MDDAFYMKMALALAEKGRGYTSPNPVVGAVVVNADAIVGKGWHEAAGRPHAEVNALDAALRKALVPTYPHLAEFDLADYKVHILDGDQGTAATTRVLIDMQNQTRRWTTVGASANIIEASWLALADAVEYGLTAEGAMI